MRWRWPLAIFLLVSSCRDTGGPGDDSARLIEVVGAAQVGGTPLDTVAKPLTVRITDLGHRPVAGATVTWATTDGGVLIPQDAATDADGIARALWVLGWRVGQQEATATMADAQQAAVFTAAAAGFQATSLSTGDGSHACAIAEAGGLFCWGPNGNGELGDGSSTDSERPVAVQLEPSAAQVVTSRGVSCALTTGGSVYCWGGNDLGQLGNGSTTPSALPTPVSLPPGRYRGLSAFRGGVCAVAEDGGAYCWGDNQVWGEDQGGRFGIGSTDSPVLTPARVVGDIPWQQVELGDDRACGIREGGQVYCWGSQIVWLNIGVDTNTVAPLPVINAPLMDSLTLSGHHQCGITVERVAYCWGLNFNIGVEDPRDVIPDPIIIPAPAPLRSIHSSFKPTYALGADGKGYWWGPPPLATGGPPDTPVAFTGEIPIRAIGISDGGTCGLEEAAGTVYCWSNFSWDGPTQVQALALP